MNAKPVPGVAPASAMPPRRPARNVAGEANVAVMCARGWCKVHALPGAIIKLRAGPPGIIAQPESPWAVQWCFGVLERNYLACFAGVLRLAIAVVAYNCC